LTHFGTFFGFDDVSAGRAAGGCGGALG